MSPYKQSNLVLVESSAPESTPPMLSVVDLAAALGLGTSLLIGRYRVDLASGDWWWSDEVYTMHGWKRHEIEPGLDALRSRKHPDDRARVLRAAGEALRAGKPFACAHRIVDKKGRTRSVVVIGQGQRGVPGGSPEVAGYVVDVTPVQTEALNRRTQGLVSRAFVSQAVIEQAKGVLAMVRGGDENAAEAALREVASTVGVPLRSAAEQMMAALRADSESRAETEGTGITTAALDRALEAVRPIGRPRGRDPLLTRRQPRDRN